MKLRSLLLAAVVTVAASPLAAHDLWLGTRQGPRGPEIVVRYGHPGHFENAVSAKLLEMSARTSDGASIDLSPPLRAGEHVPTAVDAIPLRTGNAVLSATYDNGFWTQTADGAFRNAAKPMVPGGRASQWSVKYAKALTGPGAPWNAKVGHTLEIVPLSDPFGSAGALRVQVLYQDRPLANVEIKRLKDLEGSKADAVGRTDTDGTLTIPHTAGRDFLAVSHKVPSRQPTLADSDAFAATLSVADHVVTQ